MEDGLGMADSFEELDAPLPPSLFHGERDAREYIYKTQPFATEAERLEYYFACQWACIAANVDIPHAKPSLKAPKQQEDDEE